MIISKKLLTSFLIATLGLTSIQAYAASSKSSSSKKTKKAIKEAETKTTKNIINPTGNFYEKMWDKFKVGTKADREDVIKTLQKIIKDTPDEYMSYYYLGIMCCDEKQDAQALKYFETALEGYPKSADIHLRMAEIQENANNKKEADKHYLQAIQLAPNNPKALSKVGIIEIENKNYIKAEEYLTKARSLQPDNSTTLRALGKCWIELGKYQNAVEILEQVVLFDNTDANSHFLLGKAYEKVGKSEKAAEHIQLASKYGKKDATITEAIGYDIARNLSNAGKYDEAISAYKKEIKKNSNPAQGLFEMAELFEKLDDTNKALKAYQKAYELDKKMIQGIYRCVEIYKDRDDKENATKMLKLLKSNSQYREEAAEMIEEIKSDEKEQKERELEYKIQDKSTKDADLEAAYLERYESNKQDSELLENIYNYYKERGYYEEAIKWYRKYAKVGSVTDYEKKTVEKDLKSRLEQDNYYLFGSNKDDKPSKSKVSSDELMNMAFNGDNDRQKETALQILLSRKDYKDDRKVVEGMVNFYEERGKVKEASKYINQLKKLGYLSDSEAKSRKARLKGK